MQECTYVSETDREVAEQWFKRNGIEAEAVSPAKLRSFHKGTFTELQSKLKKAYDVAMKDGLAIMVKQLRIGRNDPCPCESGKKFKKCCMWKCR